MMRGDERLLQLSHQLIGTLNAAEVRALYYEWRFWARAAQLPPKGEWRVWLLMAGRGFGKTRTGAEWVRALATSQPHCEIGLIGATFDDVRHVMVDGPSGIVTISPPEEGARYYPSRHQILWPNGAKARLFAADRPSQLRGPEFHFIWADEINLLFETDFQIAEGTLDIWLPQWRDYSVKRQAALTSLAYNLGGPRLSQFVKLKAALQKQDFTTAAQEPLQSKWAGQVGARAQEIAELIKGRD